MQTNEHVEYNNAEAPTPVAPIYAMGRRIPFLWISEGVEQALEHLVPLLEAGHHRHLHLDDVQFFDGIGRELEAVGDPEHPEGLRIKMHQAEIRERILEQFRWAAPVAELPLDRDSHFDYGRALRSIEEAGSFEAFGRELLRAFERSNKWPICCLWGCPSCQLSIKK